MLLISHRVSTVNRRSNQQRRIDQGMNKEKHFDNRICLKFGSHRAGMTQYEVMQDITVGYSKALANPQYGLGGLLDLNTNGQLAAIADAKTSMFIPYDAQAQGFILAAQQTTSQTVIYYTPTGNSIIDLRLLDMADQANVTILQIGVP